tara:strand:+ start:20783 stop:21058 length:276 start_codon:yes stop_codon:yes gene_type:complete
MKLQKQAVLMELQLKSLEIFEANNKMMTVAECAAYLGCHPGTVKNKIEAGKIITTPSGEGKHEIPKLQFVETIVAKWRAEQLKENHARKAS